MLNALMLILNYKIKRYRQQTRIGSRGAFRNLSEWVESNEIKRERKRERERERERERKKKKEQERKREGGREGGKERENERVNVNTLITDSTTLITLRIQTTPITLIALKWSISLVGLVSSNRGDRCSICA
jgi:hypothetical protein